MPTIESTGLICIVRIPGGEPPLWVRKAWVGLTLPCDPYAGSLPDTGAVSGKPSEHRSAYSVPQDKAIEELRKKNRDAANWWVSKGFPVRDQAFGFSRDEAVVVSGVTEQTVRQVTDEMMGDPDR